MKNKGLLLILSGSALLYYFWQQSKGSSGGSSTGQKRQALVQYVQSGGDSADTKARVSQLFSSAMSDAEINAVYEFIFGYVKQGRQLPAGSALQNQIAIISAKYNIFT